MLEELKETLRKLEREEHAIQARFERHLLEKDLIKQIIGVIPALIKYERQAREFLLIENREGLRRDVSLALEGLCRSDLEDDSEENLKHTMTLVSKVRMGVGMGLLGQNDVDRTAWRAQYR